MFLGKHTPKLKGTIKHRAMIMSPLRLKGNICCVVYRVQSIESIQYVCISFCVGNNKVVSI